MVIKSIIELENAEEGLKRMLARSDFVGIKTIYNKLLATLGNVDGDEILALALLAQEKINERK